MNVCKFSEELRLFRDDTELDPFHTLKTYLFISFLSLSITLPPNLVSHSLTLSPVLSLSLSLSLSFSLSFSQYLFVRMTLQTTASLIYNTLHPPPSQKHTTGGHTPFLLITFLHQFVKCGLRAVSYLKDKNQVIPLKNLEHAKNTYVTNRYEKYKSGHMKH